MKQSSVSPFFGFEDFEDSYETSILFILGVQHISICGGHFDLLQVASTEPQSWRFSGTGRSCWCESMSTWLVVWNIFFSFPYIWNIHPNWRTHSFQRVSNHQPGTSYLNPPWLGVTSFCTGSYQYRNSSSTFESAPKDYELTWIVFMFWSPQFLRHIRNYLVVTGTCVICPFSWEFPHPKWRTHIFQRGLAQPATICIDYP